jgi:hypothetical protein
MRLIAILLLLAALHASAKAVLVENDSSLPCCIDYCETNKCWCGTWGCNDSYNSTPAAWPLKGCCAIVHNREWPAACANPNKCGGCGWNNMPCSKVDAPAKD